MDPSGGVQIRIEESRKPSALSTSGTRCAPRSRCSLWCLRRPGSTRVPRPFSPPGFGFVAGRNWLVGRCLFETPRPEPTGHSYIHLATCVYSMPLRTLYAGPQYPSLEATASSKLADLAGTHPESALYLARNDHTADPTEGRWRRYGTPGGPGGRQFRRPRRRLLRSRAIRRPCHSVDPSRSTAASAVRTAATFSATSWTRTMSAPRSAASAVAATVAGSRSPESSRPTSPNIDFRE